MASAVPESVPSLAQGEYGEQKTTMSMDEACVITENMKMGIRDTPLIVEKPIGKIQPGDLPLKEFRNATRVKQAVDIVVLTPEQAHGADLAAIGEHMKYHRYSDLPAPFCVRVDVEQPYTMQIALVEQARADADPAPCLVKWFWFDDRVSHEYYKMMAHGSLYQINYGKNFRLGSKAFAYLFEQMGGWQARYMTLGADGPSRQKSKGALMTGFEHIELQGPRDITRNKLTIWCELEINDEDSPIHGWDRGLVMSSLQRHVADAALVMPTHDYMLTLYDLFGPFFDDVLVVVLPYMLDHTLVMAGEAGDGKTPVLKALGHCLSALHILADGKVDMLPGFRIASDLDFVRGSRGGKYISEIQDDPEVAQVIMSKRKAYLGNNVPDAKTYQRWTAAAFDMGQHRSEALNAWNPKAEPVDASHTDGDHEYITHTQFVDMILPSFHKDATESDIKACLKRAAFIINGKKFMYPRPPTQKEVPVRRVPYFAHKRDFLDDSCKECLNHFIKTGEAKRRPSYDEHMAWSVAVLDRLLNSDKGPPPRTLVQVEYRLGECKITTRRPTIEQVRFGVGPATSPSIFPFGPLPYSAAPTTPHEQMVELQVGGGNSLVNPDEAAASSEEDVFLGCEDSDAVEAVADDGPDTVGAPTTGQPDAVGAPVAGGPDAVGAPVAGGPDAVGAAAVAAFFAAGRPAKCPRTETRENR